MTREKRRRRGRPPTPEAERKDRLIQTRVDEDLDDVLRQAAKERRTTVSQLIRNVLADTFQLVDDLVAETANLAGTVKRDAQRLADSAKGVAKPGQEVVQVVQTVPAAATVATVATADAAALEAVDAWQEVVMARDRACAKCGRTIAKGEKGFWGMSEDAGVPRPWLCSGCMATL